MADSALATRRGGHGPFAGMATWGIQFGRKCGLPMFADGIYAPHSLQSVDVSYLLSSTRRWPSVPPMSPRKAADYYPIPIWSSQPSVSVWPAAFSEALYMCCTWRTLSSLQTKAMGTPSESPNVSCASASIFVAADILKCSARRARRALGRGTGKAPINPHRPCRAIEGWDGLSRRLRARHRRSQCLDMGVCDKTNDT
jgi:hypothetical protein